MNGVRAHNRSSANGAGVTSVQYVSVTAGTQLDVEGEIVDERQVCISVNGQELAVIMCSPHDLDKMALGFLHNEGIVDSLDDVRSVHVSKGKTCVEVWLQDVNQELPTRPIITAGCGGGITFDDLSQRHEPLISSLQAAPDQLATLMRDVHLGAELYHRARGIHTAAVANQERVLLQVEDIGRHNCLDKLRGAALLQGIETRDCILLSSGRISSEMINKARRLETAIVCSRTSPTSLSVALAEAWNMTIVAYLRQNRMRVYSHPERVLDA
jgi:FdhD protein